MHAVFDTETIGTIGECRRAAAGTQGGRAGPAHPEAILTAG